MFFLEDLTMLLLWLIATVVAVNLMFLGSVLYRRLTRQRYFVEKDAAAARYRQVVAEVLAGTLNLEQGAVLLGAVRSAAERAAAEEALLARLHENREGISRLLFALGYVERWAKAAFGYWRGRKLLALTVRGGEPPPPRRPWLNRVRALRVLAVPRALAVERLGRLEPGLARVFLSEGLRDPAPEVRQFAVAMMGRQRDPAVIPLLLEEMRLGLEQGSDISLRTAKSALASYQMEDLDHFVSLLSHENPRVRFCVVDTMRDISNQAAQKMRLNKNDFPRQAYEGLLQRVGDRSADVRARAAGVVRHFRDANARDALRKLLRDESEFVRLHAVRASCDPYYQDLLPDLAARLTDVRWRVREAAARALAGLGLGGKHELYRQFIASQDRYATEQMADEIQRVGAVDDIIAALTAGGEEADLAETVAHKLVLAGKTSLLTSAVISSSVSAEARVAVLEALMGQPSDEYLTVLQFLAENDSGAVRQKALALLRRIAAPLSGKSAAMAAGHGPSGEPTS